jgi:hypothetical protein
LPLSHHCAFPSIFFLLVKAHSNFCWKNNKGGIMANTVHNAPEESMEKAVWGYVGTTVMWLSLLLTGIAVERLGLTSRILSGVLPGEVGALRTQADECNKNFGTVKLDRDNLRQTEGALRAEISKLQKQISAAPTSATTTP